MEKTEAFCISFEDLQVINREFPAFQTMVLDLLWKYHTMFYERVIDLLHLTPQERYQYLLEKQPELWQRVPRKYLTSYLGMSVSTLHRVTQKQE
jgi:hypothetical protein